MYLRKLRTKHTYAAIFYKDYVKIVFKKFILLILVLFSTMLRPVKQLTASNALVVGASVFVGFVATQAVNQWHACYKRKHDSKWSKSLKKPVSVDLDKHNGDVEAFLRLSKQDEWFARCKSRYYSERKVRVDHHNSDGNTPLYEAMLHDNVDEAKRLIASGADVNKISNSEGYGTPLIAAVIRGNRPAVGRLIDAGANMNQTDSTNGWTPLMWASVKRKCPMVKFLLDCGVDIDKKDKNGDTFFYREFWKIYSANCSTSNMRHSLKMMKLSLEHGADIRDDCNALRVMVLLYKRYDVQEGRVISPHPPDLIKEKIVKMRKDCIQALKEWLGVDNFFVPTELVNLIGEYIIDDSCCNDPYPYSGKRVAIEFNRSGILGCIELFLEAVGPQFKICNESS